MQEWEEVKVLGGKLQTLRLTGKNKLNRSVYFLEKMTLLLFENHFTLQLIMFDFAEFEKKTVLSWKSINFWVLSIKNDKKKLAY